MFGSSAPGEATETMSSEVQAFVGQWALPMLVSVFVLGIGIVVFLRYAKWARNAALGGGGSGVSASYGGGGSPDGYGYDYGEDDPADSDYREYS